MRVGHLLVVEKDCAQRKIVARQLRNNKTRGNLRDPCLKPSYLPSLIQIRLRWCPKILLLKQVSLSESLGQEKGKDQSFLLTLLILNKQLKNGISQKVVAGWQNVSYL